MSIDQLFEQMILKMQLIFKMHKSMLSNNVQAQVQ
jgi:hypothetical protein